MQQYRHQFIEVLDVQIAYLKHNLQVTFEIVQPAINVLVPPYSTDNLQDNDVVGLINLFPKELEPDKEAAKAELEVFRKHCAQSRSDIATVLKAVEYCSA